jgi:uncharacterized protein with HEPN domain
MKNLIIKKEIKEKLLDLIKEIMKEDFNKIEKLEYFDIDGVRDSLYVYYELLDKNNLYKIYKEEIFNKK